MARSALWSRLRTLERRAPTEDIKVAVVFRTIVDPNTPPPPDFEARRRELSKIAQGRFRATGRLQRVIWDPHGAE